MIFVQISGKLYFLPKVRLLIQMSSKTSNYKMFASHLTMKLVYKSIYLQKKNFTDLIYIDFVSIKIQRLDLTTYSGGRD